MLRVEFRTIPNGIIEEVASRAGSVRSIELDNAFYIEDGNWIESFTVSATEQVDFQDVCSDISGADLIHVQEIPTGPSNVYVNRVMLVANEPYPFILGIVLRQEAIPNRIVLTDDTLDVIVSARDWELFRKIADEIQEKLDAFELKSVSEIENPGEPLDSGRLTELLVNKLTADQLAVLGTAYELGYFDVPRQKSAVEVAEALGISQSTFSERLRRAERNLFELIYGRQE